MLDILTKPDHFEMISHAIEPVTGAYPDFEAGEMVDLLMSATSGERTIRKIVAQPVGTPVPIFSDTANRALVGDVLSCGRTSVVKGEIEFRTDKFEDGVQILTQYTPLTVTAGDWAEAASGEIVYGELYEVPADTSANGGIALIRRVNHYQLP